MKQVNLLPPEYAYARYFRKRLATWAAFILAAGAMVGSLGFNLSSQLHKAQAEKQRLQGRIETLKNVNDEIQGIAVEKAAIAAKLADIYRAQRKQVDATILYDLAAASNDRVFLVDVLMSIGAPPAPKPTPAPAAAVAAAEADVKPLAVLTVRGYALTNLDLTQFVSGLAKSSSLKQVNLKYGRQEVVMKLKLIAFEIECLPNIEQQP